MLTAAGPPVAQRRTESSLPDVRLSQSRSRRMSNANDLIARINAEFKSHQAKASQFRSEQAVEHQGRQRRLGRVEALFDQLREVWKPRLEALAAQFKDSVQVKPTISPGRRQGTFEFQSELARISLTLSASTDNDATKIILAYDLDILPIYMTFEKHAQIEFPLDQVDTEAVGRWFDDRIVEFVKVYLSLYENEYYLKDHMVEDPIAHVRFPKFVAGATVERDGKTYYFISEATRREFEGRSA
jgi:YHS domain-containing protein